MTDWKEIRKHIESCLQPMEHTGRSMWDERMCVKFNACLARIDELETHINTLNIGGDVMQETIDRLEAKLANSVDLSGVPEGLSVVFIQKGKMCFLIDRKTTFTRNAVARSKGESYQKSFDAAVKAYKESK